MNLMRDLILADNPCDENTFTGEQWPILELIDLYETPDDVREHGGAVAEFNRIKLLLAVEIANRSCALHKKAAEIDEEEFEHGGWDDREDIDWDRSVDSDPYDYDVDGPGF